MKSLYQNQIIDKVRQLRLNNGYSQNKLADTLGISNGQMGNIESPKNPHKYTLSQLCRICKEFGHPIEELFLGRISDTYNSDDISQLTNKISEYEQ